MVAPRAGAALAAAACLLLLAAAWTPLASAQPKVKRAAKHDSAAVAHLLSPGVLPISTQAGSAVAACAPATPS